VRKEHVRCVWVTRTKRQGVKDKGAIARRGEEPGTCLRPHTAPLTMLNDNVDVLRARSSGGGVRGNMSSSSRAALGPRSCSGDGDGRGRMDPLRGGGDSTVICCGDRSGTGGSGGL